MKEFKDKVAIVTGAASGIGRAMAGRYAQAGMKVVLADVQTDALSKAEADLKAGGAKALAVRTDVSKAAEVEALAQKTLDAFGGVHVICNNAGVAVGGPSWERTVADWEWVMGVNLWGVIHGIRVFVPIMLKQKSEGHVVNTASMAGMISGPGLSIYCVTKHAVVTLSECLHHELTTAGAKVKVSVLCPGWVATGIADSDRNRPQALKNAVAGKPQDDVIEKLARQLISSGIPPEKVADLVFKAIEEEKFYIFTHPGMKDLIRLRMDEILGEKTPTFRPML